ncbi:uncharacterized membrane protein (UPF0127 family) [Undibacterium sp. GrIS 1.8]|uniref:DUF192 domain-containing protein n=1 Tax=Undibacterium sp. GrIS 1.8 TaxID=3143934 RepID=UPI00339A82B4
MIKHLPLVFNVASRVHALDVMIAMSMFARMRGLLARPALRSGEAMLLQPCNLIHTVGMRYPIDVIFLRRDGMVLKVATAVAPRRVSGHLRAHCVLELAAGEAARCTITPGMILPIASLQYQP